MPAALPFPAVLIPMSLRGQKREPEPARQLRICIQTPKHKLWTREFIARCVKSGFAKLSSPARASLIAVLARKSGEKHDARSDSVDRCGNPLHHTPLALSEWRGLYFVSRQEGYHPRRNESVLVTDVAAPAKSSKTQQTHQHSTRRRQRVQRIPGTKATLCLPPRGTAAYLPLTPLLPFSVIRPPCISILP